jgi:hypothetical protein
MNTDDRRLLATEELKLLSSIIGRIESAIYQKQGWLFTLITGLTLALFKDKPLICRGQFFIMSAIITVIFGIADIFQRIPAHGAVVRSGEIERFLSGRGDEHDGPAISKALGKDRTISEIIDVLCKIGRKPRVWILYFSIIVMLVIISILAP